MSSHTSAIPWAQAADWDQHRDVITALYINQGKTLAQVIGIMGMVHGFHATYVHGHLLVPKLHSFHMLT